MVLGFKKGDLVEIIAPAKKSDAEYDKQAIKCIKKDTGLDLYYSDCIFDDKSELFASNDYVRANSCLHALRNSKNKMVWCAGGGYGSYRIVDSLMHSLSADDPEKILIGFSDITALHLAVNKLGWRSIHWENIRSLYRKKSANTLNKKAIAMFYDIIYGNTPFVSYDWLVPINAVAKQSGAVRGKLIGGNLSLVQSSVATASSIDPTQKILFFEDVNESYYRIDRTLNHLKEAGYFNGANAVILGEFVMAADNAGRNRLDYVLRWFAESLSIPVFRMLNVGHGVDNYPLVMMSDTEITVDKQGSVLMKCGTFEPTTPW